MGGEDMSNDILTFIENHNREKGFSPTVREIAAATKHASTTVFDRLVRMEEQGLIKRIGIRAIEVLNRKPEIEVVKSHNDVPSVIIWQDRRYVLDLSRPSAKA